MTITRSDFQYRFRIVLLSRLDVFYLSNYAGEQCVHGRSGLLV